MINKNELIKFFSKFWSIDVSEINDLLKLDDKTLKNSSSIRRYQFFAALESNFDVRVENVNKIITFGDIHKNLKKA